MSPELPETQFCGLCGHENLASEEKCAACGTLLSSEFDIDSGTQGRPIQWRWVEIFLGTMTGLLLFVTFVPVVNQVFMYLAFPRWRPELDAFSPNAIVLPHGMVSVVPMLLIFVVGGAVMGVVANRAIYREMAIGSIAAVMVLWFLWFVRSGWQIKALGLPIIAISDSVSIHLPPVLFLLTINIACMLLAAGSCRLAVMLTELVVGRSNCYTCGKTFSIKPRRPLACPACGTPQRSRGINWVWAGPTLSATLLIFFLSVTFLGPRLSFYWRCDFKNFSEACREGVQRYNEDSSTMYYWTGDTDDKGRKPGVIMDSYRYIGLMAPLFFVGPFIIAWRCRRSRFRTAGVTILSNWVGATMVAMLGLGFSQFEGVFMLSLRLHMIAGVFWCIAGAVGLGIGNKLAPNMELDVDPDLLDR